MDGIFIHDVKVVVKKDNVLIGDCFKGLDDGRFVIVYNKIQKDVDLVLTEEIYSDRVVIREGDNKNINNRFGNNGHNFEADNYL